MLKMFRLDDVEYLWTGSEWVFAETSLAVPGALEEALNHHFGHIVGQSEPAAKKGQSPEDADSWVDPDTGKPPR